MLKALLFDAGFALILGLYVIAKVAGWVLHRL